MSLKANEKIIFTFRQLTEITTQTYADKNDFREMLIRISILNEKRPDKIKVIGQQTWRITHTLIYFWINYRSG